MAEPSSTMKCPMCGSNDVDCHENTVRHVHECNACGHKDIYKDRAPKGYVG